MSKEDKIIPWWTPKIGEREKELLKTVLDNNFPNEGQFVDLFEKKISGLLGCKHAIAVTSGTAAIFLALKSLGIGSGDEVVIPDITFIATANAAEMAGAKPVLVDIDPKNMNISVESFEKSITDKTKAVIPVHVSGRASDMENIMRIAEDNGIKVVEDAAEAFMSIHKGKYLGTFGQIGCLSFSPNKTITTGQGGIILTDDDDLFMRLKELKNQGRRERGTGGDDTHFAVGYNFKMTDLQGALGVGQLEYLNERIKRMKKNHKIYAEELKNSGKMSLFEFDIEGGETPQWTDAYSGERDGLDKYLASRNIHCRRFWLPIHRQAPYKLKDDMFPNSTKMSYKSIWLPSAFTLADSDIIKVCENIKQFFNGG